MKPSHVVDQLPLWVGGDLSEAEDSAIQAHLSQCPTCCATADALRTSQAWVSSASAAPFTAEDHRQLRQRVMAQIRTQQKGPMQGLLLHFKPRWAVLMAAAAVLLLVGTRWYFIPPIVAINPIAPTPPLVPQATIPAPLPVVAQRPRKVRLHPEPKPDAGALSDPALSRIELQTDNPQIRIIWLARSTTAMVQPPPSPDRLVDPT